MIEMLSHSFMLRAFLVGSLISVSAALLGPFLVLKRYSMIGDGLAHVSFASVGIALVLGTQPLLLAIPLVVAASILILKMTEKTDIMADAAIGLISSFAMAFGILLASLSKGFSVDLYSYLFGSILLIKTQEIYLTIGLVIALTAVLFLYYQDMVAITYDEEFAMTQKLPAKGVNYLLAIMTAVTIVLGIRIVGTMLISSLIIFPAVSALQVARSFRQTIAFAIAISLFCVWVGITLSYFLNLPTGTAIVLLNGIIFMLLVLSKPLQRK